MRRHTARIEVCKGHIPAARVHAAMASAFGHFLILVGGRTSPTRPIQDMYFASAKTEVLCWVPVQAILSGTSISPPPVWRHQLAFVDSNFLVVIGGRTSCGLLGDIFYIELTSQDSLRFLDFVNQETGKENGDCQTYRLAAVWKSIPAPQLRRHSHAVSVIKSSPCREKVFVYGGLGLSSSLFVFLFYLFLYFILFLKSYYTLVFDCLGKMNFRLKGKFICTDVHQEAIILKAISSRFLLILSSICIPCELHIFFVII